MLHPTWENVINIKTLYKYIGMAGKGLNKKDRLSDGLKVKY